MRNFLILTFIFFNTYYKKDVSASCSRYEANLWTIDRKNKKISTISNGYMYECANIHKLNKGAKNNFLSIRFWSCISKEGCGDGFKKGYSSVSINHQKWLPGKVTFADYTNGKSNHNVCVKQNISSIEYCWEKGKYLMWEGRP